MAEHGDLADAGLLLALAADPHPWVLADVCIGLLAQPTVPTDLLRALTTHCIGNYDGHDGLPHVSLMDLLVSLGNGAVPVLPEIVCWWDKTAAGKYLDRETVEEATRLCEVLGASAAALLPGLKRALAFLNEENVEEPMPALDEPGAVAVIQARIEQSMLDAGTDPTLATAVSGFHGAMLDMLAGNLDGLQAEIDAAQAESQAEMREIYPELFAEGAADASDQQAADADFEEQEDELIVRLRASIGCLAP